MEGKIYFEYGQKEVDFLKSKDVVLGKAIDEIGYVPREIIPDLFAALINSIIGQQISSKAQQTVWTRFLSRFSPITPQRISLLSEQEIQACGMSMRKASYIKHIADSVIGGSLDLAQLHSLPDDDVCKRLSQIKGIGVWTAQMLMIFSMQRMDVISRDDIAILRGLRMLYRHRKITPQLFAKYKRRYSPYATVASLYLWEISHGVCEGLVDLAPKSEVRKKTDAKKRREIG
ncbi:MAG: DNA-3-methyladenine glycosylase family protein [Christensenellales bacterium]|jgi:DNA-3-methyladenine glycosylase II